MKKGVYIIISIVLIIIINTFIFGFNKKYVLIQNDGVYFGMSYDELVKIKGMPYEIEKSGVDTPFDYYSFYEEIDGYTAESIYVFEDSFLGSKLSSVSVSIKTEDLIEAKNMFDNIYLRLTNYYKTQKNYFNNDVLQNGQNEYYVELGIDNGATGINICLDLDNYTLTIFASNQE